MLPETQEVVEKFKKKGYKYLGWVNMNQTAYDAYLESDKKEEIRTGPTEHVAVLYDLKAIVIIDSSD